MHLHANALTDAGMAVLLVDPFGGRGVIDTISQQGQFSFAASTWDVFAAMQEAMTALMAPIVYFNEQGVARREA